ncbi:cell wall protein [Streptomyces sp. NPDC007084]|uniref:cell wall protein n=1 Tax=Streptomyces sp. NPDC007084 TaxID=3154313 RepID=UPI003454CB55
MSAARRSLLTATAAGTLLGALWFVPSANATPDALVSHGSAPASAPAGATTTGSATDSDHTSGTASDEAPDTSSDTSSGTGQDTASDGAGPQLADTGSVDTTPYVVGGTVFLGLGAGFVAYSVRRERTMAL